MIEFREELLSLIQEADGINIGVNYLISMMLQIGISDPALQWEFGTVRNPTLAAFNEKTEGCVRPNPPRGRGERDRHIA